MHEEGAAWARNESRTRPGGATQMRVRCLRPSPSTFVQRTPHSPTSTVDRRQRFLLLPVHTEVAGGGTSKNHRGKTRQLSFEVFRLLFFSICRFLVTYVRIITITVVIHF